MPERVADQRQVSTSWNKQASKTEKGRERDRNRAEEYTRWGGVEGGCSANGKTGIIVKKGSGERKEEGTERYEELKAH